MLSPPILVPFCYCGASVPSTNVLFSSLAASVPEKMIPGENPKHEMDGLCGNTSPACKGSPRLSHEEAQKNPDCSTCFQMALRRLKKAADNAKWSQMVLDGPIKLQMVPEGPRMPTESSRRRQMAPEGSPQMAPEGTRKLQESREGCRRPHMALHGHRNPQCARGPNSPKGPRWSQMTQKAPESAETPQRAPRWLQKALGSHQEVQGGPRWPWKAPEGRVAMKYEVFDEGGYRVQCSSPEACTLH